MIIQLQKDHTVVVKVNSVDFRCSNIDLVLGISQNRTHTHPVSIFCDQSLSKNIIIGESDDSHSLQNCYITAVLNVTLICQLLFLLCP